MRCVCGGRQYALLGLGFACALLLAFASGLMAWQSLARIHAADQRTRDTQALQAEFERRLVGNWIKLDSGDVVIRRKTGR